MNAPARHSLATTFADLTRTLTNVSQSVERTGSRTSDGEVLFEVLVTPAGAERGQKYWCNRDTLELLQAGRETPEALELDVVEEE